MSGLTQQLNKLRRRSLREIAVRGRQELNKLSERASGAGAMSDRAVMREISPASRNCSSEGSALLILDRIRRNLEREGGRETAESVLFPALAQQSELVDLIERRFSLESEALIDRAERSLKGGFDLLGFSDLSFGHPIDWLLEPISGKRTSLDHWSRIDYLNPEVAGDKKVTWELNRHGHFVTLGQAYVMTQDERYAEGFVAQAEAWMDANPPNRGINWASSLEIAFRSISWVWALHLFAGSQSLSSTFVARFLKTLIANGRHIEAHLSQYFSPNTHLTGEALGLLYLGVTLPELKRANEWRETGLRILLEQLPIQVRNDGVYFEQSSYYHRYTADFYTQLFLLARAAALDLPGELETSLGSMLDHLMWITRPDGTSPLIGDDDGGRLLSLGSREANDFRDTLAAGAVLLGRADWKYVAGDAGIEALWLLGPEGLKRYDELQASAPRRSSRAFEDGGYHVMRDGWSADASYALIDCGPHGSIGGGHAHSDALALEFASAGTTWLVDPGTFNYTGDPRERDWFRSTEAHNTVTIDGQSQSEPEGPFSWSHAARSSAREFIAGNGFDYFEGSHDGYERLADPVTHKRGVLFVKSAGSEAPGYLIVRDSFNARLEHQFAIRYHLAQGASATAGDGRIAATQGDHGLAISTFGSTELGVRVERGWVSQCYGQREAAPVGVIEGNGAGPQECVSFIVPACTGGPSWLLPRVNTAALTGHRAGLFEPPSEPASGTASASDAGAATQDRPYSFIMHSRDFRDEVLVGDGTKDLRARLLSARASIAVARFRDDCLVYAFLVCGDRLVVNGIKFSSKTQVKHCEIGIGENLVKLSITRTDRFDLTLPEGLSDLELNGTSFELKPGQRTTFTRLSDRDFRIESRI